MAEQGSSADVELTFPTGDKDDSAGQPKGGEAKATQQNEEEYKQKMEKAKDACTCIC